MLDQRGVAQRFISLGQKHHVVWFAGAVLDASDRETRHSYTLALWQANIEQVLADWVSELAVQTYRGRDVVDLAQDETGVDIALNDGRVVRSQYLVGCDGGRSLVRKKASIGFSGWDADISYLIFEFDLNDRSTFGIRRIYLSVVLQTQR